MVSKIFDKFVDKWRRKGNCEGEGIAPYSESIVNMTKKGCEFEVKTSQYRCLSFCCGRWRCSRC